MKTFFYQVVFAASVLGLSFSSAQAQTAECFEGNWVVESGFYNSLSASLNLHFDGTFINGRMFYRYEDTNLTGHYASGPVISFNREINFRGNHGYQVWTGTVDADCTTMQGSWQGLGGAGVWHATKQ